MKKLLLLLFVAIFSLVMPMDQPPKSKPTKPALKFRRSCIRGFGGGRIGEGSLKCLQPRWEAYTLDGEWAGSAVYNNIECTLQELFVDDKHRGKGVGTALFFKVLEEMRTFGCKKMTWHAYPESVAFYEKLGAQTPSGNVACVCIDLYMYIDIKEKLN